MADKILWTLFFGEFVLVKSVFVFSKSSMFSFDKFGSIVFKFNLDLLLLMFSLL